MKKHLLTVALAIVALGGAVASTAHRTTALDMIKSGPLNSTTPQCIVRDLNCSEAPGATCTVIIPEISNDPIDLFTDPGETGQCTVPLYYN